MKKIKYAAFGLSILTLSNFAIAELAVVVNPSNPINSAKLKDISDVFLMKSKKLGGQPVTPVEQLEGNPAYEKFHAAASKKTPQQVKSFWANRIFTGKGTPPEAVRSDRKVISAVAESKKAIGYVDSESVDSSVKVIATIP